MGSLRTEAKEENFTNLEDLLVGEVAAEPGISYGSFWECSKVGQRIWVLGIHSFVLLVLRCGNLKFLGTPGVANEDKSLKKIFFSVAVECSKLSPCTFFPLVYGAVSVSCYQPQLGLGAVL